MVSVTNTNKHIKNRPQKARAGLATARLLCGRYKALKDFRKNSIAELCNLIKLHNSAIAVLRFS